MQKHARNVKLVKVLLATVAAGGCVRSEYSVSRHTANAARMKNQNGFAEAPPAEAAIADPPNILPQTRFAAGLLFERQGLMGKAIAQYRKAAAVSHDYVEAYHRLGLALSRIGRHEEAVEALRKAVALSPENAALRNNLGFELMYLKAWADAEAQLRRAAALNPDLSRAHVNLGLLLSRQGRYDEALAAFETVLPEPDAAYNLGLMYRAQQRYADAARTFRGVLDADPQFSAARIQLEQLAALPAAKDSMDATEAEVSGEDVAPWPGGPAVASSTAVDAVTDTPEPAREVPSPDTGIEIETSVAAAAPARSDDAHHGVDERVTGWAVDLDALIARIDEDNARKDEAGEPPVGQSERVALVDAGATSALAPESGPELLPGGSGNEAAGLDSGGPVQKALAGDSSAAAAAADSAESAPKARAAREAAVVGAPADAIGLFDEPAETPALLSEAALVSKRAPARRWSIAKRADASDPARTEAHPLDLDDPVWGRLLEVISVVRNEVLCAQAEARAERLARAAAAMDTLYDWLPRLVPEADGVLPAQSDENAAAPPAGPSDGPNDAEPGGSDDSARPRRAGTAPRD